MKWVSLFKAESSVHSLPFFSRWTLQFHKARKKQGEGQGRGQTGRGLQWRWKRRENVWRSQNLPLHWDMIGFFPLCKNDKKKSKETQKWCSKNEDERGRGWFLAGMCVALCIFFLFRKATLGFDAVVVIRGLAAATGFRLWALLDVRLRHTPPGGEVEGHSPSPRECSIPRHAVPLQLVKGQLGCELGHSLLIAKMQHEIRQHTLNS